MELIFVKAVFISSFIFFIADQIFSLKKRRNPSDGFYDHRPSKDCHYDTKSDNCSPESLKERLDKIEERIVFIIYLFFLVAAYFLFRF